MEGRRLDPPSGGDKVRPRLTLVHSPAACAIQLQHGMFPEHTVSPKGKGHWGQQKRSTVHVGHTRHGGRANRVPSCAIECGCELRLLKCLYGPNTAARLWPLLSGPGPSSVTAKTLSYGMCAAQGTQNLTDQTRGRHAKNMSNPPPTGEQTIPEFCTCSCPHAKEPQLWARPPKGHVRRVQWWTCKRWRLHWVTGQTH